jgi:hypothetical protein
MNDIFEELYRPCESERKAFAGACCSFPETYPFYGEETLIAEYQKHDGSDGQSVRVFCCALPARFYTLEVLAGQDSIGTEQKPYVVRTGSGAAALAAALASAIASGMISFNEGRPW